MSTAATPPADGGAGPGREQEPSRGKTPRSASAPDGGAAADGRTAAESWAAADSGAAPESGAAPSRTAAPDGGGAAVIGAGLMGHGIAQVLACAGVPVAVFDASAESLATVHERVAASLASIGVDAPAAEAAVRAIRAAGSLEEAVGGARWVFEAVPERLELKRSLFAQLDAMAAPDAVLATNTSVISVAEIAAQARRRQRILGTHWWNPPYLIPLVEVVQAPDTDPAVVSRTIEFLTALGKTPVHVRRDVPGFVGNRLQHALWREAFQLIDEGVCDPGTVDTVIRSGFGLRLPALGPVENADMIGLDLTPDIHSYILPRLTPPSRPSRTLARLVADGRLGMKSGEGFLSWSEPDAERVRARLRGHLLALAGSAAVRPPSAAGAVAQPAHAAGAAGRPAPAAGAADEPAPAAETTGG